MLGQVRCGMKSEAKSPSLPWPLLWYYPPSILTPPHPLPTLAPPPTPYRLLCPLPGHPPFSSYDVDRGVSSWMM